MNVGHCRHLRRLKSHTASARIRDLQLDRCDAVGVCERNDESDGVTTSALGGLVLPKAELLQSGSISIRSIVEKIAAARPCIVWNGTYW